MSWINCKLCEKKYSLKKSYYSHVRSKHPESVAEICIGKPRQDYARTHYYICSTCDQRFFRKDSLKTHIFSAHHVSKRQQRILYASETCKLCGNKYSSKNAYYKHVRSKHPESVAEICIGKREYYICFTCDQRFLRKDSLETHIFSSHDVSEQQQRILYASKTCKLCENKYSSKNAYYKHVRSKHPESVAEICITKRQQRILYKTCELCENKYSSKDAYYKHVRSKHPESVAEICTTKRQQKMLCAFENCNVLLSNRKLYYDHLLIHQIKIKEERIVFGNRSDFVQWKEKYELEHNMSFIRKTGQKLSKSLSAYVEYYSCHRSDFPVITTGRRTKFVGSCKIGVCCPCRMRVIVKQNEIVVYFTDTHLGHTCDAGKISLNPIEKRNIAKKLSDGVSFERILEDIEYSATNCSTESQKIKRLHITNRQDLRNICKEFNISAAVTKHQNDLFSVKIWIEEMRALGKGNPVLYVKFQHEEDPIFKKEDFVLVLMTQFQQEMYLQFGNNIICIDRTHGLNAYDFYLYSLIIIDEFGKGIPIAFCFSNLKDNLVYKTFFNCIKTQVGTVTPSIFMSDSEVAFYAAWESVMGAVNYKLLCSWHIFKNWTENLSKITNMHKRELIKKVLRALCYELNEQKFETYLENFLYQLENNEETHSFCIYFKKEWHSKRKQWAMCYRKYVSLSNNMVLESMHKQIKYFYLSGLRCKRLDKSVHALMRLTNPDVFKHSIKLYRGKHSEKMKYLSKAHENSTNIKDENVVLIANNLWSVLSISKKDVLYEVTKINDNCPEDVCGMKCTICNVCIHMYLCSCLGNIIHLNICKHIHAVCRVTSSLMNQHIEESVGLPPTENEINSYASGTMEDNIQLSQIIPTNNVEDMKPQILSKLCKIIDMCHRIQALPSQNEDTRQITRKVDNLMTDFANLTRKSS